MHDPAFNTSCLDEHFSGDLYFVRSSLEAHAAIQLLYLRDITILALVTRGSHLEFQ